LCPAVRAYLLLLKFACQVPELDTTTEIDVLPELGPTAQAGYYFLLPIVVLMWCLVVERLSPALSAFWATVLLMFIVLTQRPLKGIFRKMQGDDFSFKAGFDDLINGICQRRPQHDRHRCGHIGRRHRCGHRDPDRHRPGHDRVCRVHLRRQPDPDPAFTAVISLILGMGLPTTANYIVVSTLMAPVIVELGAQNGLIVPLIAVHLFVFYFGILADDTPPVGLAAFAAAGISGGDPIRTGIQGFTYDIRTAVLPFMFIFNTQLLMIGIANWFHLVAVIFAAVVAMLAFAAGTQGYFLTKSRIWETAALLLVAFTLFRPGFFWDMIYAPLIKESPAKIEQMVADMQKDTRLRIEVKGEDLKGKIYQKTLMLKVGDEATGKEKLAGIGIELREEDGKMLVDNVVFSSRAEKAGIDFDQEVLNIQVPSQRPPAQLMFIPAILLYALIWFIQKTRKKKERKALVATAE
jgi:hypothetical protein